MEIHERLLESIHPYAKNPRVNAQAVEAVAESIREFGFRQPIVVDRDDVIVCGHTRYLAAQRLGMTLVPVHVASDLTPEQVHAYRIVDNAAHDLSSWSDSLASEIGDIVLDNAELNRLIADLAEDMRRVAQRHSAAVQSTDGPAGIQLEPHEHYDYIVVLARDSSTWNVLCERLGIVQHELTNRRKTRIGICRAISAESLLERLTNHHPESK